MLKAQIKKIIIAELNTMEYIAFDALSKKFKISISSIKRYCLELEKSNKLKIVRGGVSCHNLQELNNVKKAQINIKEKALLAKKAVAKIKSNDVIFLDAGTSTIEIAKLLPTDQQLIVFTNNIDIISHLGNKNIKVYLIGGRINYNTAAVAGSIATDIVQKLQFTIAFLGCNGYDKSFFYTTNIEEATFKEVVIKNTNTAYFIADASKKDRKFPYKITNRNLAHML